MTNKIEDSIGFALHHSSFQFKGAMKSAFKSAGFDITPEEFVTLNLIPEQGIGQGDLVKATLKDKTNVARLLNRMEAKKLLTRKQHATSGRQITVNLNPAGKRLREKLMPIVQKTLIKATQGISASDLSRARSVLSRLSHNLSDG